MTRDLYNERDALDALANLAPDRAALLYDLLGEVLSEDPDLTYPAALVALSVFRDLSGVVLH